MADIKIDYDGLTQAASSLKSIAQTYDGLCTRMKTMSSQISSTWEGSASKAFTEMMDKYYQQGSIIKSIISSIEGYATTTTSDFQQTDQECAAQIRNSF